MPEKENQHTVPQFYLRQFVPDVGDKLLWEFSKRNPERPKQRSYRSIAAESYFYSEQLPDGTWDHSLEDAMNRAETLTAPGYIRLIEDKPAEGGDRQVVAQFVGLMIMRTAGPRNHALSYLPKMESEEFGREYVEANREYLLSKYGPEMLQAFLDSGPRLQMPKNFHLIDVMERANKWGRKIIQLSWTIWKSKEPAFITSDNPAFTRNPKKLFDPKIVAALSPGSELGFPLSSCCFLIAKPEGPLFETRKANPSRIAALNTRTVLSANEFVYSTSNSDKLKSLVAYYRGFQLEYPIHSHEDLLTITKERP